MNFELRQYLQLLMSDLSPLQYGWDEVHMYIEDVKRVIRPESVDAFIAGCEQCRNYQFPPQWAQANQKLTYIEQHLRQQGLRL